MAVANRLRDLRQFRSARTAAHGDNSSRHGRHGPLVQVTDDAAQRRSHRGRQMREWGHGLFAQVAMVISCSHQACMAVIKVSRNPRQWFAKRSRGVRTAHAGPGDRRRWQTDGHPRPCVYRLHHSCFVPRPPFDVIAISSSGSSLHRSPSVRACARSRASSRRLHHARARSRPPPVALRDPTFATVGGRALLQDDDGEGQPPI